MNNLPNNTYYHGAALINNNRDNNETKKEITILKQQIKILMEELNNVNKRIDEFYNK